MKAQAQAAAKAANEDAKELSSTAEAEGGSSVRAAEEEYEDDFEEEEDDKKQAVGVVLAPLALSQSTPTNLKVPSNSPNKPILEKVQPR